METYGLKGNGTNLPKVWAHSQLRWVMTQHSHESTSMRLPSYISYCFALPHQLLSDEWKTFWRTSATASQSIEDLTHRNWEYTQPPTSQSRRRQLREEIHPEQSSVLCTPKSKPRKKICFSSESDVCKYRAMCPFLCTHSATMAGFSSITQEAIW